MGIYSACSSSSTKVLTNTMPRGFFGVVASSSSASASASSCVPVRLKIRLWAFLLWLVFTLPNVIVTLTLYFTNGGSGDGGAGDGGAVNVENASVSAAQHTSTEDPSWASPDVLGYDEDEDGFDSAAGETEVADEEEFRCYDNYTVYLPIYESTRFWVEGVGLACVGLLGLCGNGLTLAVLARSKGTKFNRLLVYLSLTDCALILFFLLLSYFTVLSSNEPQW